MVNRDMINDFAAGVRELTHTENGQNVYSFTPYKPLQHHIAIPDARDKLMAGLRYYLGDDVVWLPAYDQIAEWLTDNKGRGLLCYGGFGLGKTLICQYILPVLIKRYANKVPRCITAFDMTRHIDTLMNRCGGLLFIDDIGTEPSETVTFGTHRIPFNEICDACERMGGLLVLTTNLRTTASSSCPMQSIEERYGLRTLSRLRALTKVVTFQGDDMRGRMPR